MSNPKSCLYCLNDPLPQHKTFGIRICQECFDRANADIKQLEVSPYVYFGGDNKGNEVETFLISPSMTISIHKRNDFEASKQ